MTEVQISAILRSRGTQVTQQTRSDLYADETGFKLLEFNMGSAIGGIDQSDMARALLEHPVLAEFAQTHRLEYVDTMREQVHNMFVESGFEPGSHPVVAQVDWPTSFESLEPYMRHFMERFAQMGVEGYPCHIGQLDVRDGGVWLGERRIDIIHRLFMLEDLNENPEAPALMNPILDAAARGEVKIFTPLDSEMFASKAALAMLSDEANRSALDPDQLASLDRILPWTRMVRRAR
jgi:glutathionylspermidine synthase